MAETDYKKLYLDLLAEHFNVLHTVRQYANGIVCCGECKHCMAYMAGAYCDHMAHSVEPDGFCAWGERKSEDD